MGKFVSELFRGGLIVFGACLDRKRLLGGKGQHDIKHSKAKITSVHKKSFEQHIMFYFIL
jgi:hypothetical protein